MEWYGYMGVFTLCLGIYFLFYANDLSNKSKEEQYATESLPPCDKKLRKMVKDMEGDKWKRK